MLTKYQAANLFPILSLSAFLRNNGYEYIGLDEVNAEVIQSFIREAIFEGWSSGKNQVYNSFQENWASKASRAEHLSFNLWLSCANVGHVEPILAEFYFYSVMRYIELDFQDRELIEKASSISEELGGLSNAYSSDSALDLIDSILDYEFNEMDLKVLRFTDTVLSDELVDPLSVIIYLNRSIFYSRNILNLDEEKKHLLARKISEFVYTWQKLESCPIRVKRGDHIEERGFLKMFKTWGNFKHD